jgi:3-oxoacyl-[acyl-carrier protein] reductase
MKVLLENENAVIYGARGAIGGAVAHAFAREGARVFLAGRTREPLDKVVEKAGGIDVSFNTISIRDIQGIPLLELSLEYFTESVTTGASTHFLTARAAGWRMVEKGSDVTLTLSALFLASDRAAITGTFVNVTSGMFPS